MRTFLLLGRSTRSQVLFSIDALYFASSIFLHVKAPTLYAGVTSDLVRLLGKLSNSNDLLTSRVISLSVESY